MFECCKCKKDVGVGYIIKRKVYCSKCGEIKLNLRDKNGRRVTPLDSPKSLQNDQESLVVKK